MKVQPDNNVMTSFELWVNDHLLRNGEAFSNITSNLIDSQEPNIADTNGATYQAWIAPNTQWAYDATIPGVVVPNSAVINGNVNSDIKINTHDGKIWIPNSYSPTSVVAAYSKKDLVVRVTNESEQYILFSDDPGARFGPDAATVQSDLGFPFMYLKYRPGKSQGLAFGGFQITKFQVRAIVVTDDQYIFDAVNILFRDASETYFAMLDASEFPFNEFGALKNGSYDYRGIVRSNPNRQVYYIKEVTTSPFEEDTNSRIAKNAIGGFIDFKIESLGYPHARFV